MKYICWYATADIIRLDLEQLEHTAIEKELMILISHQHGFQRIRGTSKLMNVSIVEP